MSQWWSNTLETGYKYCTICDKQKAYQVSFKQSLYYCDMCVEIKKELYKMSKAKKPIETQVQESMPEFAGEVAGLSTQELDARLSELAKGREQNADAKEADEQLELARTMVSELSAPYREAEKALKLKSKYIIALIKERVGSVA